MDTTLVSNDSLADNEKNVRTPGDSQSELVDSSSEEETYPSGFKFAAIIVAVTLSLFLASLDSTIVTSAIPRITDEFSSLNDVGWYGSAVFLAFAATQSSWGKAYKYWSLKAVFLVSMAIFELGSLICAVAQNSTMFIAGRAVLGAGSAGLCAGSYIVVVHTAKPKWRPALTGWLGACYGIASVAGPLLGGVFTDKTTWRWCFYVNLPAGGFATLLIVLFFRTPPSAKTVTAPLKEKLLQLDVPGSILVFGFCTCFLLAVQWGGATKAWRSPDVIGCLVGFVLLFIVFVIVEWYQDTRALFAPQLLSGWTRRSAYAYNFLFCGPFYIALYYLPIYFQAVRGTTAIGSGVRSIPLLAAYSLASVCSGTLISVRAATAVPVLVVGGALVSVGIGLIYTWTPSSSAGVWIGFQIIFGAGTGLALQVPMIITQRVSALADISAVTALALFFQTLGGTFWVSAAQSLFQNALVSSLVTTNPNLDPRAVVSVGATTFRSHFPANELPGIIASYMSGLRQAFILGIATAAAATLVGAGQRWRQRDSPSHQ